MDNVFIHTRCVTGNGNEILEGHTKGSCELYPKDARNVPETTNVRLDVIMDSVF